MQRTRVSGSKGIPNFGRTVGHINIQENKVGSARVVMRAVP